MASPLPLDVLPIILSHLAIADILRVRLVCRGYLYITQSHTLWCTYLRQHFLHHNIPIPGLNGRSFEALTARELENLTIKAERYRRNWSLEEPIPTRRVLFTAVPDSRIIALKFFSRYNEHWLLSLSMTRNSGLRAFTLQCWDLKSNSPVCIARRVLHHFADIAFNKLLTGRAVLAVKTPECVGFFPSCCLAALTCRGVPLRICLIDIDPPARIQSGDGGDGGSGSGGNVGGNHTLARSPAQACVNVATLEDRASGNLMLAGDLVLIQDDGGRTFVYHFETPQARAELVDPEGNLQPERVLDVLADHNWLIVARTTTVEIYALPTSIDSNMHMEPIGRHKWQWKVDSISLIRPTSIAAVTPIQLVLRYGSIHPWPVNLIHRYVLNLSESFNINLSASRQNFPYVFPPLNTQVIGSPIRLMATYDMAVGSHGTIIYIDSHTETYFGHSDFGQRLAGTRIDERSPDGGVGQVGMMVRESSVYQVSERDEWTRIALEEEEGKIAIGHVNGRITLLDYA